MGGWNLPDDVTQAMIDRAAEGDNCGIPEHGELNMDGTCDACTEIQLRECPNDEGDDYWRRVDAEMDLIRDGF